ncbi:TIGR02281 family clan AA aspartic protease [Aureimonas sp. ME7]|uniref:retropepsin-like aspartic protease family protein n=1 Tax=Aureimonas sp. ME7 TaxID=2744252 RepID=UPI0015F782EB|nr:TIGR02281 family clan AA aspartic protease [Aureimonas sp. ME7]
MFKLLPVLVGASVVALVFPSAFERYRASLVAQGESEQLAPPAPVVEASMPPSSGRMLRLQAGPDGHFRAQARIEGVAEDVLIDTGATYVALGAMTARRLGLRVGPGDFVHQARTAQGTVPAALARARRISLGSIELRDVEVMVIDGKGPEVTLLGMSFLNRLARFSVENERMTLAQ